NEPTAVGTQERPAAICTTLA
ncbi:MAG: hypothetical protein Q4Q42_01265, partial [Planctomycetia bacterium]|nr:hypothetical protein [Planctomycetia bacterium]